METKKARQRIRETKGWFFERISSIYKPVAKLTKGPRGSIQINKIKNEKRQQQKQRKFRKNHQVLL